MGAKTRSIWHSSTKQLKIYKAASYPRCGLCFALSPSLWTTAGTRPTMQIILMRHGQPEMDLDTLKRRRMSANDVGKIVEAYETAALSANTAPPQDARNIADRCPVVISSDLPRAVQSSEKLETTAKAKIDPLFTESALPYLNWNTPKLSFFTWCIIFRILWLCGFSKNGESIAQANARAATCGAELTQHAHEEGAVLLLGHGIMNRLIARDLKKRGWKRTSKSSEKYWAFAIYSKH